MTYEDIIKEISNTPIEDMEVLYTQCRPPEKSNDILKVRVDRHNWYCERPRYFWSTFDQYFVRDPYLAEPKLVFPDIDEPLACIDDRGLMWMREELSMYGLIPYFIQYPHRYIKVMTDHSAKVKSVMKKLESIAPTLEDPANFETNLRAFQEVYRGIYSYQATVFNIYDELVWQFRELMLTHLPKALVNTYFPHFLENAYTREAMKRGLMEGSEGFEYQTTRGVLYAMATKPATFTLPITWHQSIEGDGDVLTAFQKSGASREDIEKFHALRIIIPVAVQIAEEIHVAETSGASAHLGILMTAISKHLNISLEQLQERTVEDIMKELRQCKDGDSTPNPSPNSLSSLKGTGVSAGRVTGQVKIVPPSTPREDFNDGDILVTRITDPTMVTQMGIAGAIICEIGGLVSHPAILSRELGIPCVVQVKDAMRLLRDRQHVTVDGTTGEVTVHHNPDAIIDEGLRSIEKGYTNMDTNTFDFDYVWIDPWIAKHQTSRMLKLIDDVRAAGWTPREIAQGFPNLTQLRISGLLFDPFAAAIAPVPKEDRMKIFLFYTELLQELCREDPFAHKKNVVHSDEKLADYQSHMRKGTPKVAKKIGRIVNAGYHIGYGLWTDMYPSLTYENYGPYDMSAKYGEGAIMIIKEFMWMKPVELWPYTAEFDIEHVLIPTIYTGVDFSIDPISHVITRGDMINGLVAYNVIVNGRSVADSELDGVITTLESQARRAWKELKSLDEKGLKRQYTRVKAYNYKKLYDALEQDWEFPEEVYTEIEERPLLKDFWPTFQDAKEQARYFHDVFDPRTDFPKDHWSEHFVPEA